MDTYWENFNLDCDPFTTENEHISFFSSPQTKQLLELLQHLSLNSHLLLLVTGLSGIGKTTLLKQFVEQTGDSAGLCKIQGDASITTDVLRYLFARHLGLDYSEDQKEGFSKELLTKLESMRQNQQHYILVIDDAHLLPERTLSSLLSIVRKQPKPDSPLHILLIGGPQLETTLADIATKYPGESLIHTSRIKPFNLETTEQYIYHRLRSAGMIDHSPISRDEISEIHQASGGIPAKINFHCQQFLEKEKGDYPDRSTSYGSSIEPRKWLNKLIGIMVILLLAGMTAVYLNKEKPLSQLTKQVPLPNSTTLAKKNNSSMHDDSVLQLQNSDPDLKRQTVSPNDSSIILDDEEEDANTPEDEGTPEPLTPETPNSATKINTTKPLIQENASDQIISEAPSTDNAVTTQATLPAAEAKKISSIEPKLAAKNPVISKSKVTIKPVATASAKATPYKNPILKIAASHYTVQLMGSHDKQHVMHFVQHAGLQTKTKYFYTRHNGKDWYVAVYGDFTTQQQAQEAIKQLPAYVQKQNPWARSMASIHQAIQTQKTA